MSNPIGTSKLLMTIERFTDKFKRIKAFISDWDGVFNNGIKAPNEPSTFSEADSMGLNLLRYEGWLRSKEIPLFAIITGADNPSARYLAERENFTAVYSKFVNKVEALTHFCQTHGLDPNQVACFFDDANDLSLAKECGLRFLVPRLNPSYFTDYVIEQGLCDYVCAGQGDQYALREISDTILSMTDMLSLVIQRRTKLDESYQEYFALRKRQSPVFYQSSGGEVMEVHA